MDAAIAAWRLTSADDISWLAPEEQLTALRAEFAERTTSDVSAVAPAELLARADLWHFAADSTGDRREVATAPDASMTSGAGSGATAKVITAEELSRMTFDEQAYAAISCAVGSAASSTPGQSGHLGGSSGTGLGTASPILLTEDELKALYETIPLPPVADGAEATETSTAAGGPIALADAICYPELHTVVTAGNAALAAAATSTAAESGAAGGVTVEAKRRAAQAFAAAFEAYETALHNASNSVAIRQDAVFDARGVIAGATADKRRADRLRKEIQEATGGQDAAAASPFGRASSVADIPLKPFIDALDRRAELTARATTAAVCLREAAACPQEAPAAEEQSESAKPAAGGDVPVDKEAAKAAETAAKRRRTRDVVQPVPGAYAERLLSQFEKDTLTLNKDLKEVERLVAVLPNGVLAAADTDLATATAQLGARDAARNGAEAATKAACEIRSRFHTRAKEFEGERQRLLLWSRQQKTNIDALNDADGVQEFCRSLLENLPMMDDNFAVLLELAESLLPSPEIEAALVEANEVWLNLLVTALERLRHTLVEIHPTSLLEAEVRAFAAYTASAAAFLGDFQGLLSAPTDEESQALVAPVVEECHALIQELSARHGALDAKLFDFASRMEALRDNYATLRRTVLGRLTFLAQELPTEDAVQRRSEEYQRRMKRLRQWVSVKARGIDWTDVQTRIESLQKLLGEERRLLDEEQKAEEAVAKQAASEAAEGTAADDGHEKVAVEAAATAAAERDEKADAEY